MRPFNRDHPHVRSPEGVMSCDEIRHWLRVLHEQFAWPWETLGRTLGIGEGKHVASKLRGNSWIYPGEQIRMSRQLDRIICGEFVPRPLRAPSGQLKWEAVVADIPVPLHQPPKMAYDLASGRLRWKSPRLAPESTLPGWNRGIANWEGTFGAATICEPTPLKKGSRTNGPPRR